MKYLFIVIACLMVSISAMAADEEYVLVIHKHRFEPSEITIPAGKRIKLKIENKDATPEEFHSDDLKREKIILGNKSVKILIGPLDPGRYKFMGEFHESTAKGSILVK